MNSGQLILEAALARFESQEAEAIAILSVYLNNPVGVGEHPDIVDEVVKLTRRAQEARDCQQFLRTMVKRNDSTKVSEDADQASNSDHT